MPTCLLRFNGVEWNDLHVEDIERIEVARSPVSALLRSNAMGCVINIITRKPENKEKNMTHPSSGK